MLKKRIIPKMLLNSKTIRGTRKEIVVTTKNFERQILVGSPVSQAKIYESQLADELIIININSSENEKRDFKHTIERMSHELATPLAAGGGISNLDQAKILFESGADKIILNTGAIENPRLIEDIAEIYGRQSIIVGIDVKKVDKDYKIFSHNGKVHENKDLKEWISEVESRGSGEIMISAIDKDGAGKGLDTKLLANIIKIIKVPLIATGGCGKAQHFIEGFREGADAVAAGTFFSQRDQNPLQCKSQVSNAGIPIRS